MVQGCHVSSMVTVHRYSRVHRYSAAIPFEKISCWSKQSVHSSRVAEVRRGGREGLGAGRRARGRRPSRRYVTRPRDTAPVNNNVHWPNMARGTPKRSPVTLLRPTADDAAHPVLHLHYFTISMQMVATHSAAHRRFHLPIRTLPICRHLGPVCSKQLSFNNIHQSKKKKHSFISRHINTNSFESSLTNECNKLNVLRELIHKTLFKLRLLVKQITISCVWTRSHCRVNRRIANETGYTTR